MTFAELETLVDYHYWARDRMFSGLDSITPEQWSRTIESSFKSLRDTAVHIWASEVVWCARWRGSSPTSLRSSETFPTVRSLREAWQELERDVRAVLRELGPDGLDRRFDYKSLGGMPQSSIFWQMLQHVVNHASYHRGQITTMLRQVEAMPPKSMDLIAFYREREASQNAAGRSA